MASFNKIIIVGYLGRDPELKYSSQGTAYCNFSVATTEKRKDRAGEAKDVTTWFRVTAWGRQAEIAHEYLAKGRQVYVEGRLRLEEFTDRDGNQRTSLEVTTTDLHFLGRRDDSAHPAHQPTSANAERDQTEDEANVEASASAKPGKKASKRAVKEPVNVSENDDFVPF